MGTRLLMLTKRLKTKTFEGFEQALKLDKLMPFLRTMLLTRQQIPDRIKT